MRRETWLFVQPERLDYPLGMPVHDDPERAGRMLTDLLACARPPFEGEPTWWCGPRSES